MGGLDGLGGMGGLGGLGGNCLIELTVWKIIFLPIP